MPTESAKHERERLRRLSRNLSCRARIIQAVRAFFEARNFLEVETPVRIATPALEAHIDAEPSGNAFLRTSPELHMKRLLAAGYERIFQVGPCFRAGERGPFHHPEYSMLEWYRIGANYSDLIVDTKQLIAHVASVVCSSTSIAYQGQPVHLMPVWEYLTVRDLFMIHAGWDPVADYDEDRFNLDLVGKVLPRLPCDRPVVLADYPAAAGGLARCKPGHPGVCERWELFIGGLELANAYSELVDADDQRRRFENCAAEREARGQDAYSLDEAFLSALELGLPECAGIALGVDRLAMLLCDAASLDDLLPFRDET